MPINARVCAGAAGILRAAKIMVLGEVCGLSSPSRPGVANIDTCVLILTLARRGEAMPPCALAGDQQRRPSSAAYRFSPCQLNFKRGSKYFYHVYCARAK